MSARARHLPWFLEGVTLDQRIAWSDPRFKLCPHGNAINEGGDARCGLCFWKELHAQRFERLHLGKWVTP